MAEAPLFKVASYDAFLDMLYAHARHRPPAYGLETTRRLLKLLGALGRARPYVVVGGTNGKGSTASAVAFGLQQQGFKTGLFTSPHLFRFTERMRLDGVEITQSTLLTLYEDIRVRLCELEQLPTFFELSVCLALLWFEQEDADIAILEVGLGGRLDAVNAVDRVLTVLTPIGRDHCALLGDTLEEIAAEKAALLWPEVPAVVAPQTQAASSVISERAQQMRSEVDWVEDVADEAFDMMNLRVASRALHRLQALGFGRAGRIDWSKYSWPGRKQSVGHWLFDGAHNPPAAKALVQALDGKRSKTLLLWSCLQTKDGCALLQELLPLADEVVLVPMKFWKAAPAQNLVEIIEAVAAKTQYSPPYRVLDVDEAYAYAEHWLVRVNQEQSSERRDSRILVTGSTFLVGLMMARHLNEPIDPPIAN